MPRFYCPSALNTGEELSLPAGTARHVQVLRLQPDHEITLFNGQGGEFKAVVTHMGRSEVSVRVGEHHPVERELSIQVNLWSSITANERMDWLLEKATELGAATLLPITAERSVLKLKGERADKKLAHWQAIAVASSEQCGRNRVLQVGQATTLVQALEHLSAAPSHSARWVLSLSPGTRLLQEMIQTIRSPHGQGAAQPTEIIVLSGPEGGLSPTEEAQAIAAGFLPVSLGNRVLRAETAPVAVLSAIACLE
ncbi:MAG: 16S rRNA (uracil(1498)-N(3))-methyltransferase [Burkholderiales bacterium]|nr:16S rRNA (uracil(1498)-N(3))-methyltransferase [Burkholderiales bacterium]